jgi:ATP-dependent exoDNAse (exonuclease V) alpha subunit
MHVSITRLFGHSAAPSCLSGRKLKDQLFRHGHLPLPRRTGESQGRRKHRRRSYKAQQLDLVPGRKIGISKERQQSPDLPPYIADRVAEQQRIAGANGLKIIEEPTIALKALSQQNATFSHHDVAKFLHTRTENAEQFEAAYLKVTNSPDLVALGKDDLGRQRFTTREMFDSERRLFANADALSSRTDHEPPSLPTTDTTTSSKWKIACKRGAP